MRTRLLFMLALIGAAIGAAPATQPSRDALARARAEAEAMIRPSGPIRAAEVAFDPAPPARKFVREYDRYVYNISVAGYPYGCYGPWNGWGWGWGCGWGWGWGGSFGVGGSYQNSSGGVGW